MGGKNGIPDYVDEVAYALDSAWSMEVVRFNFVKPIAAKDADHTSERYRVVITNVDAGDYAYTYHLDSASGSSRGFSSLIELRNSWKGSDWAKFHYDTHPENAVRVTCCHEFFHAIQFAMMWNTQDDYYPVPGSKGRPCLWRTSDSTMLMIISNTPRFFLMILCSFSFFSGSEDLSVYTNSLLTKFLFEKATGAPRIDFIRSMFFNDYNDATSFYSNLQTTAQSFGFPWATILNNFHTASFYSGSRADTARFLADAPLMPQWDYSADRPVPGASSLTKTVNPFGMQWFDLVQDSTHGDTLIVNLSCETRNGDGSLFPVWGASCIARGKTRPDSIIALSVSATGKAVLRIADWRSRQEALLIVSNGDSSAARNATISFSPDSSGSVAIFPNPARLASQKFMHFTGSDIAELRIYSVSGTLICSSSEAASTAFNKPSSAEFVWRLVNSHGNAVVPGYYGALVTRKDPLTDEKTSKLYKLLVFP